MRRVEDRLAHDCSRQGAYLGPSIIRQIFVTAFCVRDCGWLVCGWMDPCWDQTVQPQTAKVQVQVQVICLQDMGLGQGPAVEPSALAVVGGGP